MTTNRELAILNTSVLTADGAWELRTIDAVQAADLAARYANTGQITSYIGHEATAQLISTILGIDVPVNRVPFEQQVGQEALVFKVNGRSAEGRILTLTDLHDIGFTFKVLRRTG